MPYLQHTVDINDFYLCLLRAARAYGHDVGTYRVEPRYGTVNPDAYGEYFTGETGIHFCVEIDRAFMEHFNSFPMVITVTTTWERAVDLRNAVYQIDETDIQWLFTAQEYVRQNPLGPIWIDKTDQPVVLL